LVAVADVDAVDAVFQRRAGLGQFLEQQGDLVAVGRGPVVEVDRGESSGRNFPLCGHCSRKRAASPRMPAALAATRAASDATGKYRGGQSMVGTPRRRRLLSWSGR